MSKRRAGVLLHPTSFPSGKLDKQAWQFLDWMESAHLSVWQMLPLTQPVEGLSPYQSLSPFAMNPALLPDDWEQNVDKAGFERFLSSPPHWLEAYTLFVTLRKVFDQKSWNQWPDQFKFRDDSAIEAFKGQYQEDILHTKKEQFALYSIWQDLKKYANEKNILLFGDVPIFIAFDSADVWMNPKEFKLDKDLNPKVVAGVPPDYFSDVGQRWGNPHYDWDVMKSNRFEWWQERVNWTLDLFDVIRIDHFRGLEASWEIDANEETAINGRWVKVPGAELLSALEKNHHDLPLVAEDLGVITEEVVALKEQFGLPGMSILQFGFNGLPDNPHSLKEQVKNSVVYTGTHDNETTRGWWDDIKDNSHKNWIWSQLNSDVGEMPWPMIHAAMNSPASMAVVPLQDFLMLNNQSRMNVPGTVEGNWQWRFKAKDLTDGLAKKISSLVDVNNRFQSKT